MSRCTEHLERVLSVAIPARDILEHRVDDAEVPAWCEERGWASFLLSLEDASLRDCEAHGLATVLPSLDAAPRDLRELAHEVAAVTELPALAGTTTLAAESLRSVRLRKRAQLSGLLSAVSGMAGAAERIVDVGSGSGHFTRLSAELFERHAVGLERDPARVASAQARRGVGELATFVAVDARDGLRFGEHDLAIGLHACGELGDRLVEAAARAHCDMALVSCCLQKILAPGAERARRRRRGLELGKAQLGLTNLTAQPLRIESEHRSHHPDTRDPLALGQLLRRARRHARSRARK